MLGFSRLKAQDTTLIETETIEKLRAEHGSGPGGVDRDSATQTAYSDGAVLARPPED